MTSVAVRIQHHPSRVHLLPDLRDKLEGLPTEVVTHCSQPPSPWAGYQLCLAEPPDSTHLLIIQDDAVPVPGFAEAVEQIATANPEVPVCLFLARYPRDTRPVPAQAMKMGRRYVTLSWRSFMPVVCVLWPRQALLDAQEWTVANPRLHGPSEPRSDDAMLGRWKLRQRRTVLATVPSIVEHPDEEMSTIGLRKMWGDNQRRALFLASDAREYDWSMP